MYSWADQIINEAKHQVKTMVAEVSGVEPDDLANDNKNTNDSTNNKMDPIYSPFQLPINYLPKCDLHPLSQIVVQDLELVNTKSSKSMYHHLFQPSHPFAEAMVQEWRKNFTTNRQYLEDTQRVIQETVPNTERKSSTINHAALMQIWKDTKQDDYFLEKYCYVEWDILASLNRSPGFMQILSMVNVFSPALSLVIPIIFLIFPFILLKIKGIPISFSTYIEVLKDIAKHHFIGKTLSNLASISLDKLLYIVLAAGMYFYQIYQNILLCQRFYANIQKINDQLCEMRDYLGQSVENMDDFITAHQTKPSYSAFCYTLNEHRTILREFIGILDPISPNQSFVGKLGNVGYMLKCYYELHSNQRYDTSIRYSFGFEGFLDNLRGINWNWRCNNVAMIRFTDNINTSRDKDVKTVACKFEDQCYPPHAYSATFNDENDETNTINETNEINIKNTCEFDKKIIITGPNASGKTTLLKTTTINVIFSQQFGCGYYSSKSMINPYTHIHSYLNIPDTSERDSLFQAESRRCKEIIDVILANPEDKGFRHYCIFDELYSGTNPLEATKSAYAFLKYLTKFDNVDFILTTHYVSICSKLKKCKQIRNCKMDVVVKDDGSIKYLYKMKRGISKVQGAVRILEDMNYPSEIINSVKDNTIKDKKPKKNKKTDNDI